jgi:hypothetical protein
MKCQACLAAVLSLLMSLAFGGSSCDQRTTTGSWMFRCEGELSVPDPTAARSLGTCTATRDAFWNCTGDVNLGGAIIAQTFLGQAHNNADCTGTIHYETTLGGQPAPPLDIKYLILDGGDTIWGLPLNSGGVLTCTLRRLSANKPRFDSMESLADRQ